MSRAAARLLALVAILALPGCAEIQTYGAAAAQYRRQMNDLQAKGTLDALCDLSAGSVGRLPSDERDLVMRQCGLPAGQYLLLPQLESAAPNVSVRQ